MAWYHMIGASADTVISTRVELARNLIGHKFPTRMDTAEANELIEQFSPSVAAMILKAKIRYGIDSSDTLENGCIGRIGGCKVFVSPDIVVTAEDCYECSKCMVRTTRAIAFAEQFSEIEAYRPESRFADAVKGLYLFGAKTVIPTELVTLDIGIEVE